MIRTHAIAPLVLLVAVACTSGGGSNGDSTCSRNCVSPTEPTGGGGGDGGPGATCTSPGCDTSAIVPGAPSDPTNGVRDGGETDVDCGGATAPKCALGKGCLTDDDCNGACNYAKRCVEARSCRPHLGGDTCGIGEVEDGDATHEDCCRTLPVAGFTDPQHPGKTVYLDKYEITAGRVRAFIEAMAAANDGRPDIKTWISHNRPAIWDPAWDVFMPTDYEGGTAIIARRLLGDPRPEDTGETGPPGPGVVLPPKTDEPRNFGVNYQFGPEIYADLHGSDCGVWNDAYGFPTFWYSPEVMEKTGQIARPDSVGYKGQKIPAKDVLDVKAMNCITNAMLQAFCTWDGGQLATDEVLDYVTATPPSLGNVSGCGTQYDNHGELLGNNFSHTVQKGGRCPAVTLINATFDGGDALPVPNSPLNIHNYDYPDNGAQTADKSWEVAAPGRASLAPAANGQQTDVISLKSGDEPWVDLAGNLNEAALETNSGKFSGKFALKYRGVAYGSARSDLNMQPVKGENILRAQRPEVKAAYTGGRCMRFK